MNFDHPTSVNFRALIEYNFSNDLGEKHFDQESIIENKIYSLSYEGFVVCPLIIEGGI